MAASGHLRGSAPVLQLSGVVLPPKMNPVLALHPPLHPPQATPDLCTHLVIHLVILPAQVTPFPLFPSLPSLTPFPSRRHANGHVTGK